MSDSPRRALVLDLLKAYRNGPPLTPAARFVLAILADFGDFDPSITGIAVATGYDRRTVTRTLAELERGKWIERDRKPPRQTRYRVAEEWIRTARKAYEDGVRTRGTTPLGHQTPRGTTPLEQGHHAPRLGAQDPIARGTTPHVSPKPHKPPEAARARARDPGGGEAVNPAITKVLEALGSSPKFRHLANEDFAARLAVHCREHGFTGRHSLAEVAQAIVEAGAKVLDLEAAGEILPRGRLVSLVVGFVKAGPKVTGPGLQPISDRWAPKLLDASTLEPGDPLDPRTFPGWTAEEKARWTPEERARYGGANG